MKEVDGVDLEALIEQVDPPFSDEIMKKEFCAFLLKIKDEVEIENSFSLPKSACNICMIKTAENYVLLGPRNSYINKNGRGKPCPPRLKELVAKAEAKSLFFLAILSQMFFLKGKEKA